MSTLILSSSILQQASAHTNLFSIAQGTINGTSCAILGIEEGWNEPLAYALVFGRCIYKDNEVWLSSNLSRRLNVTVGDRVTIAILGSIVGVVVGVFDAELAHSLTINQSFVPLVDAMMPINALHKIKSFHVSQHVSMRGVSSIICLESNSTISNFLYNSTSVTFLVSGIAGTIGYCNVTISKEIVSQSSDIQVYYDAQPILHRLSENSTNYFIYFTYSLSLRTISIRLAPDESILSLSVSRTNITWGESVTVSGSLIPSVEGTRVTLTYMRPDKSTLSRNLTITSSGSFTDTFTPDQEGKWDVKVTWPGNINLRGATCSASFTVSSPSFPYLIPIVIFVVMGALVGVLLLFRRPRR
jgi:hypothetical protein